MASPSFQRTLSSVSSFPNIDEHQWVINIRKSIEEERYSKSEITPVSIFIVPKDLMVVEPNCYIPQHVAIGPNHYWRPELHDMEGYKVAAAKRIQKLLPSLNFEDLADRFMKLEPEIRACYQRFIKYDGKTLAWIMAVDTAFLLEFLQIYTMEGDKVPRRASLTMSNVLDDAGGSIVTIHEIHIEGQDNVLPRARSIISHVHDYAGTKAALDAIIRDIMMLENQIPLFLMRETLKAQFSSEEAANDELYSMLKGFCREVCPFKFIDDLPKLQVSKRDHLLDYMYHMILPQADQSLECEGEAETDIETQSDQKDHKEISLGNAGRIIELLYKIKDLLSQVKFPNKLRSLSKPIALVVKLPWTLLCKQANEGSSSGATSGIHKPPEISIPSATELARAGVRFSAIREGTFAAISFDPKKGTLNLPTISLDANTEVVLRNLVAYEASFITSGSLYFTRYTEFMNGIIDTAQDVKFLRARIIVSNHLKSDEEAAKLWNGMSRSIRSTDVHDLDQVIKDVNRYYNSRRMIKVERCLRLYVYESWQFLTFLAAVLLLLFEMFEAFCSVYNCSTIFHFKYSTQ